MMNRLLAIVVWIGLGGTLIAQPGYWQQAADYKMEVDMDVEKNQFTGSQDITYTNNSPDTLDRLFFHLFYNAFQPNSMMDTRSRTIADPDDRVGDRISKLSQDEIGYIHITSLTVDGIAADMEEEGTILEADLRSPILPGQTVQIQTVFNAQVPLQIRRTGRDSKEGVRYSMTQWYPRLCEYDEKGWHANPYIGREFHGIWGDWVVGITIDPSYVVGATGLLTPNKALPLKRSIKRLPKGKIRHEFVADKVIDFAWGADPDYQIIDHTCYDGTLFKYYFQPGEKTTENWEKAPVIMDEALRFINENFGKYPYPIYSIIQGGDGGMEYPMATLITGERSLNSLIGVMIHELMHSWYQFMLASNEALYPWMDEGFTTYASRLTMNHLKAKGLLQGSAVDNPMQKSIEGLAGYVTGGIDEPMSTHADHYNFNTAYSVNSYNKGAIYLEQLKYIVGEPAFKRGMLRYFDTWKFKHTNPDRFIRIMEKESGMDLKWYNEYWVNSTKYPDYAIDTVQGTTVHLKKIGEMPMPLEVVVTTEDDKKSVYYIPITLMRKDKPNLWDKQVAYTVAKDWPWTHPDYELKIKEKNWKSIEINPEINFVDTDRSNNRIERD